MNFERPWVRTLHLYEEARQEHRNGAGRIYIECPTRLVRMFWQWHVGGAPGAWSLLASTFDLRQIPWTTQDPRAGSPATGHGFLMIEAEFTVGTMLDFNAGFASYGTLDVTFVGLERVG